MVIFKAYLTVISKFTKTQPLPFYSTIIFDKYYYHINSPFIISDYIFVDNGKPMQKLFHLLA